MALHAPPKLERYADVPYEEKERLFQEVKSDPRFPTTCMAAMSAVSASLLAPRRGSMISAPARLPRPSPGRM
mgnify:CR=1 FL=1